MTKPFAEYHAEQRRLCLLRCLQESAGHQANASLLDMALHAYGLVASLDQIKGDIAWLGEQGLVTTRSVATTLIATSTQRGLEVARGVVRHPGVAQPAPSAD